MTPYKFETRESAQQYIDACEGQDNLVAEQRGSYYVVIAVSLVSITVLRRDGSFA